MNQAAIAKKYPKARVEKLKRLYQSAPYKGEPYMKYLRLINQKNYFKLIKDTIQKLEQDKPKGTHLGNIYNDFKSKARDKYQCFWADDCGLNYISDCAWFNYPSYLWTGDMISSQLHQNIKDKNNFLKKAKAHQAEIKDIDEQKENKYVHQTYFSYTRKQELELLNQIPDIFALYNVTCKKYNDADITRITKATDQDMINRLKQILKRHINREYARKISHAEKEIALLTDIGTDCLIAAHGHAYINSPYNDDKSEYHSLPCDKYAVNHLKKNLASLNQMNVSHFQLLDNAKKIYQIEKKCVKTNHCTNQMGTMMIKYHRPTFKQYCIAKFQILSKLVKE